VRRSDFYANRLARRSERRQNGAFSVFWADNILEIRRFVDSTLLPAVETLLNGIGARVSDNFISMNKDLRDRTAKLFIVI
jgi:hypothetical protein